MFSLYFRMMLTENTADPEIIDAIWEYEFDSFSNAKLLQAFKNAKHKTEKAKKRYDTAVSKNKDGETNVLWDNYYEWNRYQDDLEKEIKRRNIDMKNIPSKIWNIKNGILALGFLAGMGAGFATFSPPSPSLSTPIAVPPVPLATPSSNSVNFEYTPYTVVNTTPTQSNVQSSPKTKDTLTVTKNVWQAVAEKYGLQIAKTDTKPQKAEKNHTTSCMVDAILQENNISKQNATKLKKNAELKIPQTNSCGLEITSPKNTIGSIWQAKKAKFAGLFTPKTPVTNTFETRLAEFTSPNMTVKIPTMQHSFT